MGQTGSFSKGTPAGRAIPTPQRYHSFGRPCYRLSQPLTCATSSRALLSQAKGGNVQAAKVLLDRLFGRPKLEVELSGDSQLSMEQRVSIVNRFFGIEPSDENLQFGTKNR